MIFGYGLSLPTYTYGVLLLIAYFVGIYMFSTNCRKLLKEPPSLVDVSLVGVIGAVFGARLFYIILFPEQFNGFNDYLALHEGGLVFYGGLVSALIFLSIYCLATSLQLPEFFDLLSPSIATAHAIGRLGCIINGCCYGLATDSIQIYRLNTDPPGFFRHPTQLYELLFLTTLSILLLKTNNSIYIKNKVFRGATSGIYLISYSFFRFLVEFLRGDNRGKISAITFLSPSQVVALFLFAFGIGWLAYCRRKVFSGKSNEKS